MTMKQQFIFSVRIINIPTRFFYNIGSSLFDKIMLIFYSVSGENKRSRRSVGPHAVDRSLELDVYQCYYDDCLPPIDPSTQPPPDSRPEDVIFWSDVSSWLDGDELGWIETTSEGDGYRDPVDGLSVIIKSGM